MANELIEAQRIPSTFILPTEQLVQDFRRKLMPLQLSFHDLSEIINQIADMVEINDKAATFSAFRRLPFFDRIANKQFLNTIERQHVFRAAVFDLACGLYRQLEQFGVFDSYQFRNKFPYAFECLLGDDVQFLHIPF